MNKSTFLFWCLLCSNYIFGQQTDLRPTPHTLDSLINRYLDSLGIDKTLNSRIPTYSTDKQDDRLQLIADRAKDSLLKKYLDIFDLLFRTGSFYPDKAPLSTPEQKIKYLITYCVLSNIYPTRTFMEALLENNPLFLFQESVSANCPVWNPYPMTFKKKTIKRLKKEFNNNYFADRISKFSDSEIFENVSASNGKGSLLQASTDNAALVHETLFVGDYLWKILFCIIDTTGRQLDNAVTVTYHGHNAPNINNSYGATPGYASLPPGYTYIQVTKNNSTVPLKIKQQVYLIRDLILNAWDHPQRYVENYEKDKTLSRENTFILHIQLVK